MRVYRITGIYCYPANSTSRTTVRRSQKNDLAYYEDEQHARRGLIGIKSGNGWYADPRIEVLNGEWEVVDG